MDWARIFLRRRPGLSGWNPRSVAAASLLLLSSLASGDIIHIKGADGEVVEGVIDEERSDENRVFIRTPAGLLPIARSRIERIESRENISAEEREADLAAQQGDLEKALDLYLKAYASDSQDETLGRKIADTKERIESGKRQRYARDFIDIDAAIKRREFDEALTRAQSLVARAPDEAARVYCLRKLSEVHLAQARDFTNMVNYGEAEKAYRQAIEAAPRSALPQLELAALIAESPSRRAEAFALYREGLTYAAGDPTLVQKPDLLKHRYNEAQLYFRDSLYREAAELFWNVVQADTEDLYPKAEELIVRSMMAIRAKLVADTDENRRALEILRGVIEHSPSRADAQYVLGRIYCERKDWAETLPRMEKAVGALVGPNSTSDRAEARHCLAMAYRNSGRLEDAVVQLQALLAAQPSRYDALCELGEIYQAQLEHQKALTEFSKAIAIDGGIFRAYLGAARTERQLHRYQDAVKSYKKLIELSGNHHAYYFELGLTYADLDDHRAAREQFAKAVTLINEREGSSPSAESKRMLAEAYTQLGLTSIAERNYYEAIQNFDLALANKPGLAAAYDGKGQAFRELGKLEDAEGFFKEAISHEPENPKFLLNLGIFLHKFKKDRAGALPYYMKYFEAGGNDPQVRDWIRECGGTPPRVS